MGFINQLITEGAPHCTPSTYTFYKSDIICCLLLMCLTYGHVCFEFLTYIEVRKQKEKNMGTRP